MGESCIMMSDEGVKKKRFALFKTQSFFLTDKQEII